MSLSDRIRIARINAGFPTAQGAAERYRWAPYSVRDHEAGRRTPSAEQIAAYAKAYRVSTDWLVVGKDPPPVTGLPVAEIEHVPIYDIRVSAGPGSLGDDNDPVDWQPYKLNDLRTLSTSPTDQLALVRVAGDSMWSTLHDGDQVMIDRSVNRIGRDGLYVIGIDDTTLMVKRCQRDPQTGEIIVKSDNPAYDTFRVSDEHRLRVIGQVVWIGRRVG